MTPVEFSYKVCWLEMTATLAWLILQRIPCFYLWELSLWRIPRPWNYPCQIGKCTGSLFKKEEELFFFSWRVLIILTDGIWPHEPWWKMWGYFTLLWLDLSSLPTPDYYFRHFSWYADGFGDFAVCKSSFSSKWIDMKENCKFRTTAREHFCFLD